MIFNVLNQAKDIEQLRGYLNNYVLVVNTTASVTVKANATATVNYTPAIPAGYKVITNYLLQRNNPFLIDYFISSNAISLRNTSNADITSSITMQSICIRNI